jgi:hypothetical protein
VAKFFSALANAVVDRSPDELITAVIVALALSLAMAGLYRIGRKSFRENLMPLVGLMIVANLASMAVGAGYLASISKKTPKAMPGDRHAAMIGTEPIWTEAIFRAADLNRDGLLTDDEASQAASEFVRKLDASGKRSIDPRSLSHGLRSTEFHVRSRSQRPGEGFAGAAEGPGPAARTQGRSNPNAFSALTGPAEPDADQGHPHSEPTQLRGEP